MPKSLKITFAEEGCELHLDEVVEGFAAVVQNGLVNIATERGSDPGNPERGTTMFRDALQGRISDLLAAQHISNLAALDTLFYLRGTDDRDAGHERLSQLSMRPFEYVAADRLFVNAVFTGDAGTVIGVAETL